MISQIAASLLVVGLANASVAPVIARRSPVIQKRQAGANIEEVSDEEFSDICKDIQYCDGREVDSDAITGGTCLPRMQGEIPGWGNMMTMKYTEPLYFEHLEPGQETLYKVDVFRAVIVNQPAERTMQPQTLADGGVVEVSVNNCCERIVGEGPGQNEFLGCQAMNAEGQTSASVNVAFEQEGLHRCCALPSTESGVCPIMHKAQRSAEHDCIYTVVKAGAANGQAIDLPGVFGNTQFVEGEIFSDDLAAAGDAGADGEVDAEAEAGDDEQNAGQGNQGGDNAGQENQGEGDNAGGENEEEGEIINEAGDGAAAAEQEAEAGDAGAGDNNGAGAGGAGAGQEAGDADAQAENGDDGAEEAGEGANDAEDEEAGADDAGAEAGAGDAGQDGGEAEDIEEEAAELADEVDAAEAQGGEIEDPELEQELEQEEIEEEEDIAELEDEKEQVLENGDNVLTQLIANLIELLIRLKTKCVELTIQIKSKVE